MPWFEVLLLKAVYFLVDPSESIPKNKNNKNILLRQDTVTVKKRTTNCKKTKS